MIYFLGRPQPRLTWWHENSLLDDTYTIISEKTVKNELHLAKLQRHHLHTVLTCQASNNNITAPLNTVVTLNLNCEYIAIFVYIYLDPIYLCIMLWRYGYM